MGRADFLAVWGAVGSALGLGWALPSVRYAAPQLECARFRQVLHSELETNVPGRVRRETVALAGVWAVRATAARGDSVRLEAWFDSLALTRASEDGTLAPDTDGLIGGRYRGTLSADGRYRADARPFVPDDVAEVADLSRAAEDVLPRLPPAPLALGAVWSDSSGMEIRRLADSVAGDSLLRFRVTRRVESREARLEGDTMPLAYRQTTEEEGVFVWHPRAGLLRRERRITVETSIPTSLRVRRPVRSRIEQQIVLERLPSACPVTAPAPSP